MATAAQYRRKSQMSAGISLIALVFLLETYTVDRQLPNPASPLIWALLIAVAGIAAAVGLWCRHQAGKLEQR